MSFITFIKPVFPVKIMSFITFIKPVFPVFPVKHIYFKVLVNPGWITRDKSFYFIRNKIGHNI